MNSSFKYYILALFNFFNFEGKATRPEFWFFNMYNLIIDIIISLLVYAGMLNIAIISMYFIIMCIPKSSIMIRRLRDADLNIYISLPYIISNIIFAMFGTTPYTNQFTALYLIYIIILIMLLCFPSKEKKAQEK